jgi:hypothetical protein
VQRLPRKPELLELLDLFLLHLATLLRLAVEQDLAAGP